MDLPKAYDPKSAEERWYPLWEERGYFHGKVDPSKRPFSIVIPPPNVTGELHMGHALNNTLQDIVIRYRRMDGYEACWFPGTDHASIAVHVQIERGLKDRKLDDLLRRIGHPVPEDGRPLTRHDLGREGFMRLGWAWKEKYGHRIREQLKALGCSCDWERERFTLDEGLSNAVLEVFVRLYEEGYIYRGQRIINWCPRCRTSLSDLEVVHEEAEGRLYYIKYPLEGSQSQSQSQSQEAITIATTRPETMLADTAVAVHPEDERFKDLIGRTAILPLLGRKLPIVADPSVARDFGTGALKVTPAHDLTDFEIAQRHSLEAINIFNEDATTNEEAGPYKGLERFACRKRVLEDLKGEGLLVKEEPYTHSIGHCQRCHTVIEPRLSTQWFVRMEELARPAIEAVRSGKIAFIPRRWEKIYFDWMENVEDWCISRQLWWGHRIPAWHCQDCQKITVGRAAPSRCAACGSERLEQDEDILDTWFSSALWPFSIMGWPQRTEELKYFYPTSLLVTGPDIIFFWVARMIVMGLHFMGEVPFEVVLFNPIVKDEKGRRMSKSLGTGVDPLELKEQYGMDALRFTLAASMTKGQDLKLSLRDVEGSRKFLNKIWNAARFSLGHLKDFSPPPAEPASLPLEDRWILSRLQGTIAQVRRCLEGYDFNQACSALYAFIWHDLCDWYLEVIKGRLYGEDGGDRSTAQAVLHRVLGDALKLLHPFVPFITEELWQHLPHRPSESVVIAPFPQAEARWRDPQSESEMALLQELITAVRTLRSELGVKPDRPAPVRIRTDEEAVLRLTQAHQALFRQLARVSDLEVGPHLERPPQAPRKVTEHAEVFLSLDGLIDVAEERVRLVRELKAARRDLEGALRRLEDEDFLRKAPPPVIAKEKRKLEEFRARVERLEQNLALLGVRT